MAKYTTVMGALGADAGIAFKFGGTIASTLHAHRVIQWVQETRGEAAADTVVNCRSFFLSSIVAVAHLCTDANVP